MDFNGIINKDKILATKYCAINLVFVRSRTLHLDEFSVISHINIGKKLRNTFVVLQRLLLAFKVAFDDHGLEVGSLIVENGAKQMPQSELWP